MCRITLRFLDYSLFLLCEHGVYFVIFVVKELSRNLAI